MLILIGFIIALSIGLLFRFFSKNIYSVILKFKEQTDYKHNLIFIFITLLLTPICIYLLNFNPNPLSNKPEHWGQLGDFFGGILNPIFAFASLIALLYTIKIQSSEMADSREEMMQSRIAQESAASSASLQLVQQIALSEYTSLRDILIKELDQIELIYAKDVSGHSIDFMMDVILSKSSPTKMRAHRTIQKDFVLNHPQAMTSTHAENFVISVQNAKRTASALLKSASILKLNTEDSSYYQLMLRLATFCALASFIPKAQIVSLRTNNKILKSCIFSFFKQFMIDVSEFTSQKITINGRKRPYSEAGTKPL